MKKLITILFILIPIILSAQEKKINYMNFPISIGIGFETLYSVNHIENDKYLDKETADYNSYTEQAEEYQQIYNETGDYWYANQAASSLKWRDTYSDMGYMYRFSSYNIPIFLKVNLWRFHIIPTYSIPLNKVELYNDYELKNYSGGAPSELVLPRNESVYGNYWEGHYVNGGDYLSSTVDGFMRTSRKGVYCTFDIIKQKSVYPFTLEIGVGFFTNVRKFKTNRYMASTRYKYSWMSETEYHYNYYDGTLYRDLPHSTEEFKASYKEVPIILTMGWKNIRLKFELVVSELDNYGTWGFEFIL